MKFPKLTGTVSHVDPVHYGNLVDQYTDLVSKVEGVKDVILFGSVSTPGLSDVDLVVTVADSGIRPRWEDISLLKIAQGHPAESIIAHDVFVWPESVAKHAESFFYVDQQTVLKGQELGGELSPKFTREFRQLLSMDYLIHRFDSLSQILFSRTYSLRGLLLFISTLRHTCRLAVELNLLPPIQSDEFILEINQLRSTAIERQRLKSSDFDGWPERIIDLLWDTMIALGKQLNLSDPIENSRNWTPSSRLVFIGSDQTDGVGEWKKIFHQQSGSLLSRYVRSAPLPSIALAHIRQYGSKNTDDGRRLAKSFPKIFNNVNTEPSTARQIRVDAVLRHWNLISEASYGASSGKGYIGVSMPSDPGLKDKIIKVMASLNASRLSTVLAKTTD